MWYNCLRRREIASFTSHLDMKRNLTDDSFAGGSTFDITLNKFHAT